MTKFVTIDQNLFTSLPVNGVGGIEAGAAVEQMLLKVKLDFAPIGPVPFLKVQLTGIKTNLQ